MPSKRILIGILFCVWMFFSTNIIISIYNRHIEIQDVDDFVMTGQLSIYYWIDEISVSDNLFNTFSVYGWLFGLPEVQSEDKKVSLLLKSDNATYEIESQIFKDEHAIGELKNKGLEIENPNIRFGLTFSPLNFEDGIYQMCLSCKNTDENSGIVETGYFFEKGNGIFQKYEKISEPIAVPDCSEENRHVGYGWVDSLTVSNDRLYIRGWGYLDGIDSTYQHAIIKIASSDGTVQYFKAYPNTRTDLIGFQNNLENQNSGISATIDITTDFLKKENIEVYIFNENKWFSFQPEKDIQYSE